MRIQVNLASRPFVELRPFFLRLRLLMAALAVVGLALFVAAHLLSAKAAKQQAELDSLRDQTIAAQRAKLRTEQRMRQAPNAEVLDRAHFLNTLFLHKSFSWTAVMMDLENVLPAGVQVTSIEPAIAGNGQVVIRLRVAGERDRAIQLVRNLERSRRFLEPRLGSEAAQTREASSAANGTRSASGSGVGLGTGFGPGTPNATSAGPLGVEFEILANYNPLPAGEPYAGGHGNAGAASTATDPGRNPARNPGRNQAASPRAATAASERAGEGLQPNRNARAGYPREGVVLPPFRGTQAPSASQPPASAGGVR